MPHGPKAQVEPCGDTCWLSWQNQQQRKEADHTHRHTPERCKISKCSDL